MSFASRLFVAAVLSCLSVTGVRAQSVFVSELADPRLNYLTDRFVEIYNPGPSPVDLTGWTLTAVGNGAEIFTWNLSGTIQPGQALVAGDQTTVIAFPVDFPAEAWSESNSTWNGKVGDGARLRDASSTIVDDIVVPTTVFENLDLVRVPSVTGPSPSYVASEWSGTPIDFPTQGTPGTHAGGLSFPAVESIAIDPATPLAGDPVNVSAVVIDSGANLTAVELRWGLSPASPSNVIAMALVSGDTWTTLSPIPGQSSGATVVFEIEATNDVPLSTVTEQQSYSIAPSISIAAIQGQALSSPYIGQTVRTQGAVTAVFDGMYVIQDGTGAWNGLWVAGATTPSMGDAVDVQGVVSETYAAGFAGTTVLSQAQILVSSSGAVPAPQSVSTTMAASEAYEGVLVQVIDATCSDASLGDGVWLIDDGSGPVRVGELGVDTTPYLGTRYTVAGAVREADGTLQLEPRTLADVAGTGDDFAPVLLSADSSDLISVRAVFSEPLDAVTAAVEANYGIAGVTILDAALDAGDATRVILTTEGLENGSYTLTVSGVEDLAGNAVVGDAAVFEVQSFPPPAGYYDTAIGLNGSALRLALHQIIDDHNAISYTNTLAVFQTSDDKPNGKVWDMYSDTPGQTPPYEYTFGVDAGSSAAAEGQGYNREHSWPRAWFGGEVAPMNSDLFQLYPTDIYVNSIRGSFPYGEVDVPDYVSANGGKRGPNTWPGYTGTVFEPIDAYKGDFARSYFYMTVRYYTEDAAWPGSDMTDGADLLPWALDMLYAWHVADPVSAKERERNHVLFGVQNNRNPFIDHPEYVAAVYEISTSVEPTPTASFTLYPNVPNPFSDATAISFSLVQPRDVRVTVYDVRGREVRELMSGLRSAGTHRLVWNGQDGGGRNVAAGAYFYRVQVGAEVDVRRMVLLK